MFVRSAHALALFPGGFGTLDEGFEVLTLVQTGKSVPMPVVLVDHPGGTYWRGWMRYVEKQLLAGGFIGPDDLHLFRIFDNVQDATQEIAHFYSNYHSLRTVRDDLVIRLQRRPSEQQLKQIEERFGGITMGGGFRLSEALPVESDEPALAALTRLVFRYNRRDSGKLRMLIDSLNDL